MPAFDTAALTGIKNRHYISSEQKESQLREGSIKLQRAS